MRVFTLGLICDRRASLRVFPLGLICNGGASPQQASLLGLVCSGWVSQLPSKSSLLGDAHVCTCMMFALQIEDLLQSRPNSKASLSPLERLKEDILDIL